jgi:thymidylate synthase (FAD)
MIQKCKDKVIAKVVGVTQPVVDYIPDAEGLISYAARVSNPKNQENFDSAEGLLRYCVRNAHWSVFEMLNIVVEIKAPRDISRQILRHKTAVFQEFSQRYAEVTEDMFVIREGRLQDEKNRQNSLECSDSELLEEWDKRQEKVIKAAQEEYEWALKNNIAKECARVVLPEGNTMSSMYMNANARTWLHYVDLRSGNGTQTEHIWIAELCREAIKEYIPTLVKMIEIKENK